MKYIFLVFPILFGCSIYQDFRTITVKGLNEGTIIITSDNYYKEISINTQKIELDLDKGEYYYISYYPIFYGNSSRYNYGAVITEESDTYYISAELGILTKACNELNRKNINIDNDLLGDIIIKVTSCSDPWIYNFQDLLLYLNNEISIGSIDKYKVYEVDSLDFLKDWTSENTLFNQWYKSIQSFYNNTNNTFYRLEIMENGTYNGFEIVN